MKKKILLGLGIIALTAIVTTGVISKVQAQVPPDGLPGENVTCNCSAGGSTGCRADHWGSTCATTEKCWEFDKNCN